MKYRKLDANNDYVFGQDSDNFYIDVPEAPAQLVLTTLRLWTNEWFIDLTQGIPYLEGVLQNTSAEEYDFVIKTAIISVQAVNSLPNYQSIYNGQDRSLTINATISTQYGVTPITLTL